MKKLETATRLSFVEDRSEIMDFLVNAFADKEEYICQGRYKNAEEAITFLPKSDTKLVIVDIGLPGKKSGIDCVREVKALRPDIQFMMFTVFDAGDQIFESLKAGASGYLLKTIKEEKVVHAVKELLNGGAPMSHAIARKVTDFFFNGPREVTEMKLLSQREQEVLALLAKGKLYKEIAEEMDVVIGTVKQHVHNIYQKLHVSNKTEAINLYLGREL
ncbi:LuxR C-terminal-related transcriptional regulator [Flavilitoribacter nigricans]|uniref:DNA-binding response regulator n=1 Tax=Flavilitoribacter nigricans (strain ATCC 23147 / DSM 23189 / NBRC 102662 / NCIMB 1420 / SS-2) TaxID=1122177 RepID=A0A2D0MXF5_FLAN2|nr:response regulator transcription factor [Flavilitoribacter nigricans]PHN00589.1 DNA-binding response regulator [Flavilitoribacter nigricans DSM 23189 = NBRC 102662]